MDGTKCILGWTLSLWIGFLVDTLGCIAVSIRSSVRVMDVHQLGISVTMHGIGTSEHVLNVIRTVVNFFTSAT